MRDEHPVIPPAVTLPEITVKAIGLSVVLAAILAAANAYLGLFAGMTVSASIPAAVVSMAVLRWFPRSNILENNIVQTAASSGEALAAGVIFTIPALILIGYWQTFEYWQTTVIAAVGGLLGVLFTIPLRRALIVDARLRFPEGVATAEVLKVGMRTSEDRVQAAGNFHALAWAALLGGAMKLGEAGIRLWAEAWEGAIQAGRTVFYFGMNLSPALLAVGFIVGFKTSVVVFLGGILGWMVLLPAYGAVMGVPGGIDPYAAAQIIWGTHIRYVGIGAMLVGGLWTLLQLRAPLFESLSRLMDAYQENASDPRSRVRTERDASLPWILGPLILTLVLMAMIYADVVGDPLVAAAMTVVMATGAFLFSAVAAYMAGLVGSSSNPVSGVTIATLMVSALLLVAITGRSHPAGPAAALVIAAVVCCAAAMGGDNLQDLKTGHLVGATPWKQQVLQVVGVGSAAVVIVPILTLLQAKYGIGAATADHPHPLTAPQATLMAHLAQSVFGAGLPWPLVGLGAVTAVVVILIDRRQASRGAVFRMPVLAMALGIYLPLKLSVAILTGGLIAASVQRIRPASSLSSESHRGLLYAAGLITGEALMGILLAVPLALTSIWSSMSAEPFALFSEPPYGAWPGLIAFGAVAALLHRVARADGAAPR